VQSTLSVVVARLIEPDVVLSVDNEVTCIDVVPLYHLLEQLWLVDCTFLHEVYGFILHNYSMVNVVIELYLQLVLQLT
jgi:hypothetical protein